MILNEKQIELIKKSLNNRQLILLSWIACEMKVNVHWLRRDVNKMRQERKDILELMHLFKCENLIVKE